MRISTLLAAAAATAMATSALAQPPAGGAPGGGRGGLPPEQLETIFKGADANKDSKLDKAEFLGALKARQTAQLALFAGAAGGAPQGGGGGRGPGGGEITQERRDMQFAQYDSNMDGSVSLTEFQTPPARGGRGGGGGGGSGPGAPAG